MVQKYKINWKDGPLASKKSLWAVVFFSFLAFFSLSGPSVSEHFMVLRTKAQLSENEEQEEAPSTTNTLHTSTDILIIGLALLFVYPKFPILNIIFG